MLCFGDYIGARLVAVACIAYACIRFVIYRVLVFMSMLWLFVPMPLVDLCRLPRH